MARGSFFARCVQEFATGAIRDLSEMSSTMILYAHTASRVRRPMSEGTTEIAA